MAATELVGYDYLAAGLGVETETARIYALARNAHRFPDYPRRVNPGQRSPLFRRVDADRFLRHHRPHLADNTAAVRPVRMNLSDTVDYPYIADRLRVSVKTAYVYGSPTSRRRLPGFPAPVTPPASRTPLFDRTAVDAFIAQRIAAAGRRRGRVRAAAVTDPAEATAEAAAAVLGRPVNLENRAQLREILFTELALPATRFHGSGPSVTTAALRQLFATHPPPFLEQVLRYREATAPNGHVDRETG